MFSNKVIFICFCLQTYLCVVNSSYTTINTRKHLIVYHYTNEGKSERNLPLCNARSVCSVLHKRYWLPPVAERICRCPNNEECSWKWTRKPDNRTMLLNNRAQLKFCSPLKALHKCTPQETALITERSRSIDTRPTFDITVGCYCSNFNRWKHFKTTRHVTAANSSLIIREEFKCVPILPCESTDFCGNVRTDYKSNYYHCFCPAGHLCVFKDKIQHTVEELLYKGPAYRAICEPYKMDYDYSF